MSMNSERICHPKICHFDIKDYFELKALKKKKTANARGAF